MWPVFIMQQTKPCSLFCAASANIPSEVCFGLQPAGDFLKISCLTMWYVLSSQHEAAQSFAKNISALLWQLLKHKDVTFKSKNELKGAKCGAPWEL